MAKNSFLGHLSLSMLALSGLLAGVETQKPNTSVKEQPYVVQWQKLYGGKQDDVAMDVVALEGGDSAIVGTCKSYGAQRKDICVLRMDRNGNMKWRLWIGGKKNDEGKAIARSADGSILVLGRSKSYSKEYDYDLLVAKVSTDGKLIWRKTIGGSQDEYPGDIAGTDDGGAIVVGSSESFQNGYRDIYLVKIDQNGAVKRQRILGGERDDEALAITRLRGGGFAVAGYREMERAGDSDFFVMKIDEHTNRIWFRSFGGEYADRINGLAPTLDGGVYAVGTTASYGSEQTDLAIMKIGRKGDTDWFKIYGYKYYEYGHSVVLIPGGGVMAVGGSNTIGKGDHSAYFLVLAPNGKLIWSKSLGGEDTDKIYALTRLSDHSIVAVGETESFGRSKQFYLIRLKPNKRR